MPSPSLLVAALAAILPSISALNITVYQPDVPLVPSPLPPSHAQSDGDEIISLFQTLGRNTIWKSIANISFEGDTYEPEGMVRLVSGDVERFIVSAGEYTAPTVHYNETTNGTDRSPGAGFAHLVVFDGNGSRIADATLTPEGALEYHNGGIDFDGQHIWCTIAQYRPNTTAYVARVDPTTMNPRTMLHIKDHQGSIVHDVKTNNIYTLNWGSRIFNLGGIALVDANTMFALAEVPVQMTSFTGYPVTQNPVEVAVVDGKLRLYFMPDQHNSTLFVYEAEPGSPFQFGGTGGIF
ncbi:hypothetical protein LTS10_008457 [Elasticomyces elasticus]|nr:hypothetical protein LTS10_008457 [Elasticomyces elasticus]